MKKFEAFLEELLKIVFREYPYDKAKAKSSFEKVKAINKNMKSGDDNGH